jgi:putative membrane protein
VRIARVRREAVRAFRIGIESRTRAATGVLIYLSLAEHRAELVADAAINGKVAAADWGEAMAQLIADVRDGRPGDGIVAAVTMAGDLLERHFPRSHDDQNEMPDRLIEL